MPPVPCERIYRQDPFLTRFQARVTSCIPHGDGTLGIELDRTAFYPTGGGQPFDTGRIGGLTVVDVREEGDGRILHVARAGTDVAPRGGDLVDADIDWARRFDHMQQHSGQHILSRAFVLEAGAPTRSFHLGEQTCTIDLDLAAPEEALMRRAEAAANEVIAANVPVRVTLRNASEVPSRPVLPPGESVRLVAVGDFDETPCGGTHVGASGQVGAVLVRSWEKFKGGTRVTFLCGRRVVAEAARLAGVLDRCGARLSVPPAAIAEAIERLQESLSDARRSLRAGAEAMAALECEALEREARTAGDWTVVVRAWPDRTVDDLQRLAQAWAAREGRAALLAGGDPATGKVSLVFARSEAGGPGAPRMGEIMAAVCRSHGGRGGGGAALARGGNVPAAEATEALAEAFRLLEGPAPS